jgi:Lysyl oxidase
MTAVVLFRVLPAALAGALLAVTAVVAAGLPTAAAGSERLPDLDQAVPRDLVITRATPGGRAVYRLGFRSAVSNVGRGPLIIVAHRPDRATRAMAGDQVIERAGAPMEVVPGAGRLRYVVSSDHRHWHLLGFDSYELRPAGRRTAAVRDRKTGFCLGDRYEARARTRAHAPPKPVYTGRCGLDEPGLLGIKEGISVGYGDDYKANLEGQYLPLTGLRPGRYVLVHRVNADRALHELDYRNNAASLLLDLRRRHGEPMIRVVRSCPATARCEARGKLAID